MTVPTLAMFGFLFAAQAPTTTAYTKLDKKTCQIVETREQGGYTLQRCTGVGGVDLLLDFFDSRENVRLAHALGEDDLHLEQVSIDFSSVGEVIEWRMAGKKAVAAILRFYVHEPDGPDCPRSHPFLVVAKVRPGESCVTQVIDARTHRDANLRARRFADRAQSSTCLWQRTGRRSRRSLSRPPLNARIVGRTSG